MNQFFISHFGVIFLLLKSNLAETNLPTIYQYYTDGGIIEGLSDSQDFFTLNGKSITIYSGSLHYFRVPRAYWKDRLRKMRAAGLNTVETYVPWNLHEPQSGVYDFGTGGTDMEDFLHLEEFLKLVQQEDLFALVRPGPYIGAEWEFGGLPSWILRNTAKVRSSTDDNFMRFVKRYFGVLLPKLAGMQFTKGGPIIAMQIENEFGNTGENDVAYLQGLKNMFEDNSIEVLLYTSDCFNSASVEALPGILQAINFDTDPKIQLDKLSKVQTSKPTMVMQYWTGWYDHVAEDHHLKENTVFREHLDVILDYPASFNLYTFVGGTNYGFLNGANSLYSGTNNSGYQPVITSYDCDAPLAENGDYTEKYDIVRDMIEKHTKIATKTPSPPPLKKRIAYQQLTVEKQLLLSELIDDFQDKINSKYIVPMETLPINNNNGQSYGYMVYRKTELHIPANAELIIEDYVRDVLLVLVNGVLLNKPLNSSADLDGFGYWRLKNSAVILSETELKDATLDLVVGNMGRVNVGNLSQFYQWKGLKNQVYLNYEPLTDWTIVPLEFKKSWTKSLVGWHDIKNRTTPALYKVSFTILDDPQDTYINMRLWTQGIVIVNGFVLGRHIFLGPQLSLYLPGSLLVKGTNDIIVFEHFSAADTIDFITDPLWTNELIQMSSYGSRNKFNVDGILFVLVLLMNQLYHE